MTSGVSLAIRADRGGGRRKRAIGEPTGKRRSGATDTGSGRVIAP